MALTEIPIELSSTPGIVDNSNATAITIDSSENVGIGTSSPNAALDVLGTTSDQLRLRTAESEEYKIGRNASTGLLDFSGTQTNFTGYTFGGVDGERMRIDASGNVGIGITPSKKLTVFGTGAGNATVQIEGEGGADPYINFLTNNTQHWSLGVDDSDADKFKLSEHSALGTNDYLVVDVTGNVGIGGTSSARLTVQNDGNSTISITSNDGGLATLNLGDASDGSRGQIVYDNSDESLKFSTNNLQERMRIDSNGKIFMTEGVPFSWADSSQNVAAEIYGDSSDNLIFRNTSAKTERMRIDASGNWMLGTTDSSLYTSSTENGLFITSTGQLRNSTNAVSAYLNRTGSDGTIVQFNKDGTTIGSIATQGGEICLMANSGGGIRVRSDMASVIPVNVSRSNLDATTDLGSSSARFKDLYLEGNITLNRDAHSTTKDVVNISTAQFDAGATFQTGEFILFGDWNGSVDKMLSLKRAGSDVFVVDASGNLLVGTTTASISATNNTGAVIVPNGASQFSRDGGHTLDINRVQDGEIVRFRSAGNTEGSISISGSTTSYNTSSDQRLKDNIVDAPSASDDIDAIQVRSFDWKADGSHQKYGMVAQELQSVAPEAVSAPEDPEDMMGVDYSKLVPMMLKEIQSLRARVAQLES
jgi:hypothetical protein